METQTRKTNFPSHTRQKEFISFSVEKPKTITTKSINIRPFTYQIIGVFLEFLTIYSGS